MGARWHELEPETRRNFTNNQRVRAGEWSLYFSFSGLRRGLVSHPQCLASYTIVPMTADQKRELRQMRHRLAGDARRTLSMRFKLDHSPAQLKAAVRRLVDQNISQAVSNLRTGQPE